MSSDLPPVDECEAITVAGGTVWAIYASMLPIARLDHDRVQTWRAPPEALPQDFGIRALANDGQHVALAGDDKDHHSLVLARLDADKWQSVRTARLTLPDGSPLPQDTSMHGVADCLHVFTGGRWYQLTVSELVDRARETEG